MKRIVLSLVLLALATSVLAHGGHKHAFLGTVKSVSGDALVVTTTADGDKTFTLTPRTTFAKGDAAATRADLGAGVRVAVHVEDDGKTAARVKIAQ